MAKGKKDKKSKKRVGYYKGAKVYGRKNMAKGDMTTNYGAAYRNPNRPTGRPAKELPGRKLFS